MEEVVKLRTATAATGTCWQRWRQCQLSEWPHGAQRQTGFFGSLTVIGTSGASADAERGGHHVTDSVVVPLVYTQPQSLHQPPAAHPKSAPRMQRDAIGCQSDPRGAVN